MSSRPAPSQHPSLAVLLLAAVSSGCGEPWGPPDVVLVSLDSVRADALTFRDELSAPRLTRLAERGTAFEQAIAGTSWTLPAHAEMFTGQPPAAHGVHLDDVAIDEGTPTLPELLAGAGYQTAGWWTGWYVAGDYGFERGFGLYENGMTAGVSFEDAFREALDRGDEKLAQTVFVARDVQSHQDVTSGNVLARARAVIEGADPEEPLFLFLHLFDPHYDYVPPEPWDTVFDPDYSGDMDGRGFFTNKRIYDPEKSPPRQVSDRDRDHLVALYRGEIAWTDQHVGDVLDVLDECRGLDRALVVVTGDHGEEFFEHGGRGHRQSLYDEVLRVPLLVVPPGGRTSGAPAVVSAQVGLSDLLPTVLDYTGLEIPESVLGRSLRPALEGQAFESAPQVSTLLLSRARGKRGHRYELADSLRTPTEKLVRSFSFDLEAPLPRLREVAWYDLASDPGETRPVTDPGDPRVVAAWERLESELDRLRSAAPRTPLEQRLTRVRELFAGDLADLGYAGEDEGEDRGPRSPSEGVPWAPGPQPRMPRPDS